MNNLSTTVKFGYSDKDMKILLVLQSQQAVFDAGRVGIPISCLCDTILTPNDQYDIPVIKGHDSFIKLYDLQVFISGTFRQYFAIFHVPRKHPLSDVYMHELNKQN